MSSDITTTVLFVDDEPFVLEALRRLLHSEGYRLLFSSSAHEALSILEASDVQVVVSDYRMPGMNGGELMQKVSEKWPDTVRIILSGFADIASVVTAINEGEIYKFISKPWQNDELKEVIRNSIERYWQHAELKALAQVALVENENIVTSYLQGVQELSKRNYTLVDSALNYEGYRLAFLSSSTPMLLFKGQKMVDMNDAARTILAASDDKQSNPQTHPLVVETLRQLNIKSNENFVSKIELEIPRPGSGSIRAEISYNSIVELRQFFVLRFFELEHTQI